jgi:pilus assembly protein CpaD
MEISSMKRTVRATAEWGGTSARLAAAAVLAATLAGCYTAREPLNEVPTDYRQRHPITLQEGNRSIEIFVGTNRGGLTPAQRADVLAFAHVWKREATGGILIDVPTGTPNERAANDTLREIESILSAAGLPAQGIAARPYRPVDPTKLATIRINYQRIKAEAGPCGLWPHDLGPADAAEYGRNAPYWNLGCATQHNLAAMVDNPADLVQPRGEQAAYSARRTVVLDKYRKGDSTATTYPNANQGKISDVGQ